MADRKGKQAANRKVQASARKSKKTALGRFGVDLAFGIDRLTNATKEHPANSRNKPRKSSVQFKHARHKAQF